MNATAVPAAPAAEVSATRSLSLDFDLAAPPEKVWRALTQADLLARWLMPNDLVPTLGHKFSFEAAPPSDQWDGIVHCRILEAAPPKRLKMTWVGGPTGAVIDTVVTWTLTPTGGGTRLHVQQAGFSPENTWAFQGAQYGWQKFFGQQLPHFLAEMA